jgi:phage terminase large subunit GpA-like protein
MIDAKQFLESIRAQAFRERRLRPCWQWAEEYRIIPKGLSAKPGPYRVATTPFMREPMESYDDPSVSIVVLMLASRIGKTATIPNLLGRDVMENPDYTLLCYPTLDSAKKFRKKELNPFFRENPCFNGLIDTKSRTSENEMMSLFYPGGNISLIGANSPSGFRQVQARKVIADEIDAMDNTVEGDPIKLLLKRADNYEDAVQILMSTPTIKGLSRIENYYLQSDQRKYFVPSPYCGEWHVLAWENLRWEEGKPETAQYIDPFTGDPWTEKQRCEMILAGEWRPTAPFTGIRGYQCNAMVSLFGHKRGYKSKYHQWAGEFLDAKHESKEALQVWRNTFLAETYEEEAQEISHTAIFNRRIHYPEQDGVMLIPWLASVLTCGIDVQGNRLEMVVYAWGENYEAWAIAYNVIDVSIHNPRAEEMLALWLLQEFRHESGAKMTIDAAGIDTGYETDAVYRLIRNLKNRGVNISGVKGFGSESQRRPPLITPRPSLQNTYRLPIWHIGADEAKTVLYGKAQMEEGVGVWHFPSNNGSPFDEQFFKELFSERVMTKYSFGRPYKVFRPTQGVRNEPLDVSVYALGMAKVLHPNFTACHANLIKSVAKKIDENAKEYRATKYRKSRFS